MIRFYSLFLTTLLALSGLLAAQVPTPAPVPQAGVPAGSVPAAAAPITSKPVAGTTTLGIGDLVEFSVFGVPDLTSKSRVNDDGELTIPLAGLVKVAGMTLREAEKAVATTMIAGGFLKAPQISLFVVESVSQNVNVLGEVNRPGTYPMLGARTLYDAVSAAGGLTQKAGETITVRHHEHPDQPIAIPLHSGSGGELASSLSQPVSSGDTITVSQAGIVYVVGAVAHPSGFVLEGGGSISVLKALALAGGTTPTASLTHSRIIRRNPDGKTQDLPIPLNKILEAKAEDPVLQPNDVFFIPDSATKAAAKHATDVAIQTAATVGLIFLR